MIASADTMAEIENPYRLTRSGILQPPINWKEKIKFLGPGFILSASIVGSGELIATTVLGARAGFTALWIILISCLVKVALQLEFGRHAILTGETSMKIFNSLPGVRIGKGNWTVWILLVMLILKVVQIGGILGSAAVVLHILFSSIPISLWAIFVAMLSASMIYNGRYGIVEKGSLFMIAVFTIFTLASLISLQFTPYEISLSELLSGFHFQLSNEELAIAIGAFGITGVASDEIIAYNYWCIEKGYARYTGPDDNTEAWKQRAKGWIHVMYFDAVIAMIIYTTVTVSFYLLGAAILHNIGTVPTGNEVIETLALIYTQTLGTGIKNIYLIGAFFVLFSSVYATLATWTRVYSDIFGQLGWINFSDARQRKKIISILSILFPIAWTFTYLYINLPVIMILSGGIIGSLMLLLVVFAGYDVKYRRTPVIKSGKFYTIIFWISVISILLVALFGIIKALDT